MSVGVLVFLWDWWTARRSGTPAGPDPWDGRSLEWSTSSPPPEHNFTELPPIRSVSPTLDTKHPELVQP